MVKWLWNKNTEIESESNYYDKDNKEYLPRLNNIDDKCIFKLSEWFNSSKRKRKLEIEDIKPFLSENPYAIDYLASNPSLIDWKHLSFNPNAFYVIKKMTTYQTNWTYRFKIYGFISRIKKEPCPHRLHYTINLWNFSLNNPAESIIVNFEALNKLINIQQNVFFDFRNKYNEIDYEHVVRYINDNIYKINWTAISAIEDEYIINYLIQNPQHIDWITFSYNNNLNAVSFMLKETNIKNINWTWFSMNTNNDAIKFLSVNLKYINWHTICYNINSNALEIIISKLKSSSFNKDLLAWDILSLNPAAIDIFLTKKYSNKINWKYISANPNAFDILRNNQDKIDWKMICKNHNPYILNLLKIIPTSVIRDELDWKNLAINPAIFTISKECKDLLKFGPDIKRIEIDIPFSHPTNIKQRLDIESEPINIKNLFKETRKNAIPNNFNDSNYGDYIKRKLEEWTKKLGDINLSREERDINKEIQELWIEKEKDFKKYNALLILNPNDKIPNDATFKEIKDIPINRPIYDEVNTKLDLLKGQDDKNDTYKEKILELKNQLIEERVNIKKQLQDEPQYIIAKLLIDDQYRDLIKLIDAATTKKPQQENQNQKGQQQGTAFDMQAIVYLNEKYKNPSIIPEFKKYAKKDAFNNKNKTDLEGIKKNLIEEKNNNFPITKTNERDANDKLIVSKYNDLDKQLNKLINPGNPGNQGNQGNQGNTKKKTY